MSFRYFYLVAAVLLGVIAGPQSASAAYSGVAVNTPGGNGYVVDGNVSDESYTIYGADFGSVAERVAYPGYENNYTIYTNTATDAVELKLWYTYTSYDTIGTAYAGVLYEAAGYILNGVKTQLTPDASVNLLPGVAYHGVLTLSLMAGDVYGFYVFSSDSLCGLSTISVSNVPLPAALPLFAASLFGFGAISRKKRA